MSELISQFRDEGVEAVVFGDLFLEDLRSYREQNLASAGMRGLFPLWKRESTTLIREWWELGFQAIVCCVESPLDASFVGVALDQAYVDRLPEGIDPCGENGEYHSFVFDGPIFERPVAVEVGEKVVRDGRYYCDLLLNGTGQPSSDVLMPPV